MKQFCFEGNNRLNLIRADSYRHGKAFVTMFEHPVPFQTCYVDAVSKREPTQILL
jgi:hypothetical protein